MQGDQIWWKNGRTKRSVGTPRANQVRCLYTQEITRLGPRKVCTRLAQSQAEHFHETQQALWRSVAHTRGRTPIPARLCSTVQKPKSKQKGALEAETFTVDNVYKYIHNFVWVFLLLLIRFTRILVGFRPSLLTPNTEKRLFGTQWGYQ